MIVMPSRRADALRRTLVLTALLATPALAQRGGGNQGPPPPQPPHFEYMGPAPAGRIASVAGVPGDTSTYYFGAASGGIWKTTDGAKTFTPIFDDEPVQAIGALAVAPSNPRIVWAGTGEAWAIRDADVMGDGIYKSTDGGATWSTWVSTLPGASGASSCIRPIPNIVYACALAAPPGRSRSAACIARSTAVRSGSASCS